MSCKDNQPKRNPKSEACPPELKKMSATEACNQVKEKEDDFSKGLSGILTAINPISAILGAFGSKSESHQKITSDLSTTMKTDSIAKQMSKCTNSITQSQSNVIKSSMPSQCIDSLKAAGLSPEAIADIVKNSGVQNTVQQNTANASNTCTINLVLDALSKMDASIDNTAMQNAINKSTGMLSSSTSTQDICSKLSVDMTACKYISQTQCCANNARQDQRNLLENIGCSGKVMGIVQSNTANGTNNCVLDASASVSDVMSSKIKNTTSQAAHNESTGLTFSFGFILLAIFLVIVVIVFGVPAYIGTKIFYFLAPIVMLVGAILIFVWWSRLKKDETKYNDPYVSCVGVKTLTKGVGKDTFINVKTRVKDKSIQGYDFFIDLPNDKKKTVINPATISDTQLGQVIYLTQAPDSPPVCTPLTDDMKTVSFMKAEQNYVLLVIGLFLLLIIGPTILAVVYFNSPKPKGENNPPGTMEMKQAAKAKADQAAKAKAVQAAQSKAVQAAQAVKAKAVQAVKAKAAQPEQAVQAEQTTK